MHTHYIIYCQKVLFVSKYATKSLHLVGFFGKMALFSGILAKTSFVQENTLSVGLPNVVSTPQKYLDSIQPSIE